jgi:hypothetical protein
VITRKQMEDMQTWRLHGDRTIVRNDGEQPSDFNTVAEFWNSGDAALVLEAVRAVVRGTVYASHINQAVQP